MGDRLPENSASSPSSEDRLRWSEHGEQEEEEDDWEEEENEREEEGDMEAA